VIAQVSQINADSSINSEDTEGLTRKERKDREKTRIDKVQQIKESAYFFNIGRNRLGSVATEIIYCTGKSWIFQSTGLSNT
jgi:hypothetical protein